MTEKISSGGSGTHQPPLATSAGQPLRRRWIATFSPPFGGAHVARKFGVRNFGLAEEENLQLFETVLDELVPEARDHAVK